MSLLGATTRLVCALAAVSLTACTTDQPDEVRSTAEDTSPVFTQSSVSAWTEMCDLPTEKSDFYGIEIAPDGQSVTLTGYASVDAQSEALATRPEDVQCILIALGMSDEEMERYRTTPTPASMTFGDYHLEWVIELGGQRLVATVSA